MLAISPQEALREQARRELSRRDATKSLEAFCGRMDDQFVAYRHTKAVIDVLEALTAREIDRAILCAPPRHGKSMMCSERYPAYLLGRKPREKVMLVAYGADLAQSFSRKARDLISHPQWPFKGVSVSTDHSSVGSWSTTVGGEMRAAGFGGTLSGAGASCFPVGTMIATPDGEKPVEYLAKYGGEVWAFDHAKQRVLASRLLASSAKMVYNLVDVTTVDGSVVRCTADHRIYVHARGYIEARSLCPDDQVLRMRDDFHSSSIRRGEVDKARRHRIVLHEALLDNIPNAAEAHAATFLRAMRQDDESWIASPTHKDAEVATLARPMSALRSDSSERAGSADVRTLQQAIPSSTIRSGASQDEGRRDCVLFNKVLGYGSQRKGRDCKTVRLVRQPAASEKKLDAPILQRRMQSGSAGQSSHKATIASAHLDSVQGLRDNVSAEVQSFGILRSIMRGQCSFKTDAGIGKLSLQGRDELREMVPRDALVHPGARPIPVRDVQYAIFGDGCCGRTAEAPKPIDDPSRRRESCKQLAEQPHNALLVMPHNSPQVERISVANVRPVGIGSHVVYDLQVDGFNNFFAEGVLVHNCLIIDDPVKNSEEANSQLHRDKTWEFYATTVRTRMERNCSQLVMLTRWHEDDLVGRILNSGEAKRWHVLSMPAIATENDPLGRDIGERLWPEGPELPKPSDGVISLRQFSALYQQSPKAQEGDLFKRTWFSRRYATRPMLKRAAIFIDGAWKEGIQNSRSAIALWGTDGANYYLIDAWAARVEYPELKQKVIDFYNHWASEKIAPTLHLCVEDAASGTALVQELKRQPTGLPIIGVPVDKSKQTRAEAVTPRFEAMQCVFPESSHFLDDFIEEHIRFPATPNDFVDTTSGALAKLTTARALYVASAW